MWWVELLNSIVGFLGNGAGGGGSSYESIATATASGGETSITLSSIPSTYKSLQIRILAKDTYSAALFKQDLHLQFNGDTGANYDFHDVYGNGTSALTNASTGNTNGIIRGGLVSSATGQTSVFAASIVDIHDYANTSKNKVVRHFTGGDWNSTSTSQSVTLGSFMWLNTAAITSITFLKDSTAFAAGSTFALYGIKG